VAAIADLIRAKFDRADEHIDTLKRMLAAQFDNEVDGARAEYEPKTQNAGFVYYTHTARASHMAKQAVVIGDIIHNVRSGLDHLAWELVKANGGTPTKDTYFPILKVAPTPDRYGHPRPPHIAGGVDPAALELIEAEQPYNWNVPDRHPLLSLHRMWNEDKHCSLILSPVAMERAEIRTDSPRDARIPGVCRVIAKRDERAELVFVPDDPAVNVDGHLLVVVCLTAESTGLPQAVPVIQGLQQIVTFSRETIVKPLSAFLPLPPGPPN